MQGAASFPECLSGISNPAIGKATISLLFSLRYSETKPLCWPIRRLRCCLLRGMAHPARAPLIFSPHAELSLNGINVEERPSSRLGHPAANPPARSLSSCRRHREKRRMKSVPFPFYIEKAGRTDPASPPPEATQSVLSKRSTHFPSRKDALMKEYDVIVIGAGEGLGLFSRHWQSGRESHWSTRVTSGEPASTSGVFPPRCSSTPRIGSWISRVQRLGISAKITSIDFDSMMKRVRKTRKKKRQDLLKEIKNSKNLDFYNEQARFIGDYTLQTKTETIRGGRNSSFSARARHSPDQGPRRDRIPDE